MNTTGRAFLVSLRLLAFSLGIALTCPSPATAQLSVVLGEAALDVLTPPHGDSVQIRLRAANDWPVNTLCSWVGNSTGADGRTYEWAAVYIGDGLVVNEPLGTNYVNTTVIWQCTVRQDGSILGSRRFTLNLFLPYPSESFTIPIRSDPLNRAPAHGEGADWIETESGETGTVPPLSFAGHVRLNRAGKLLLDVVFTGGTPLPATIDGLIELLRNSDLPPRQKLSLLASLRHADQARTCRARIAHLKIFQKRVRFLVSDPALAAMLNAAALSFIETSCSPAALKSLD